MSRAASRPWEVVANVPADRAVHPPGGTPLKAGRERVVIEGVTPVVDGGRFAVKRALGDALVVEADVFADGHDKVACEVRLAAEASRDWLDVRMTPLVNDRWTATLPLSALGRHRFTIRAWIDRFGTWRRDLEKRVDAGQDVGIDLEIGAGLVEAAARRLEGEARRGLREVARELLGPRETAIALALSDELAAQMDAVPDRRHASTYPVELPVLVDPVRARFSAWYERFPRSASPDPARAGTLRDLVADLPRIAGMGFDVLYLPPIHPIGRSFRKGPNNTTEAGPDDPGSPWAIGGPEGGHTEIHPELGTVEDFAELVRQAETHGLSVALDLAYQCSPDHPWVHEHPEWFRHRPDGTIQYAENPPKRYQDIYPIDFESEDWKALWRALKEVVDVWVERGVRIFRVDNPHTKAFAFWEWMIDAVKEEHPDVIFLSEAFTRPKVMNRLAKLGFTQSYTYFTWRRQKWELEQYLVELTQGPARDFFRPNFWPNTPDILTDQLQEGGRATAIARLVLAATLSSSYGIYGPPFELGDNRPVRAGSEEYLDSEKYQVRHWDTSSPRSLEGLIARVNRARREHPALQRNDGLRFHRIDNDRLTAYSKSSPDGSDVVLCVVNLDPRWRQSGFVELPLHELGLDGDAPYEVRDLLGGGHYTWRGTHNYVELDPHVLPAHIFAVHRTGSR